MTTNLLDERIDYNQSYGSDIWAKSGAYFVPGGPNTKVSPNTIVQLIRPSASGVIPPSPPIRSDERHSRKTRLAALLARQEEDHEYYR